MLGTGVVAIDSSRPDQYVRFLKRAGKNWEQENRAVANKPVSAGLVLLSTCSFLLGSTETDVPPQLSITECVRTFDRVAFDFKMDGTAIGQKASDHVSFDGIRAFAAGHADFSAVDDLTSRNHHAIRGTRARDAVQRGLVITGTRPNHAFGFTTPDPNRPFV